MYRKGYGVRLTYVHAGLWYDGEFCSRTDKYPYWIRDMLAYRWALHNKLRFMHGLFMLRKRVEAFLWDIVNWFSARVDSLFLNDFPPEMRHLWRESHHYYCYSTAQALGRRRVARLEQERAERRAWMDTIPDPRNPIHRPWPEAQD